MKMINIFILKFILGFILGFILWNLITSWTNTKDSNKVSIQNINNVKTSESTEIVSSTEVWEKN